MFLVYPVMHSLPAIGICLRCGNVYISETAGSSLCQCSCVIATAVAHRSCIGPEAYEANVERSDKYIFSIHFIECSFV